MTLNVPPARRYRSQRKLEAVLLDLPPRFAMLGNAVIPLMMDTRVTANWTDSFTLMMSAGWYPSARVVGMPATNTQGHFYIDVIAVLVRPWPDAAKMFHTNGTQEDSHDVSSLLKRIREGDLKRITQALLEAQDEAQAQGTPEPRLSLESYTQLLTPVLIVQLLAYLDGIHGSALKLRAPKAYHEIESYVGGIVPLSAFLDSPSQELILDMGLDLEVEKLLPEPAGWHMGKKVPLVL